MSVLENSQNSLGKGIAFFLANRYMFKLVLTGGSILYILLRVI